MEKVSLYVKKVLALIFSSAIFLLLMNFLGPSPFVHVLILAGSFLLFAFFDFRISGEKPRFLFGMNNSDTYLNKKGGFWNLFKWLVNSLGFLYDMLVWVIWGVYLLFILLLDFMILLKLILFWLIHAFIWFLRQLFPPFIFLFKIFIHYIINWSWWIYQLAFRNMKAVLNKNFFFIGLWGAVPALFIVFLFFLISQLVGVLEIVAVSTVFALVPIVWSFGEISSLRFKKKEDLDYRSVRLQFANGFDAVKSVLFYLVLVLALIIIERGLSMLGLIPNISMSLIGLSINLNMAISLVLIFLAIIMLFAGSILPTHIIYKPVHENDLKSSFEFLRVIGRKFLRYSFSSIPTALFGAILLLIPVGIIFAAFSLSDKVKDGVLDTRIVQLETIANELSVSDAYIVEKRIARMELYKDFPLEAPSHFAELKKSREQIERMREEQNEGLELLSIRKKAFKNDLREIAEAIESAEGINFDSTETDNIKILNAQKSSFEKDFQSWENSHNEYLTLLGIDIQEEQRIRIQMPVLYLFSGIFFALFGGIILAVFIAYAGNVYFELYALKEDGKASYWTKTLAELKSKNGNQPLLGFTLLAIMALIAYFTLSGLIPLSTLLESFIH